MVLGSSSPAFEVAALRSRRRSVLRVTTEGQPAQVLCAGGVWSLRRAKLPNSRYAYMLSSRVHLDC